MFSGHFFKKTVIFFLVSLWHLAILGAASVGLRQEEPTLTLFIVGHSKTKTR